MKLIKYVAIALTALAISGAPALADDHVRGLPTAKVLSKKPTAEQLKTLLQVQLAKKPEKSEPQASSSKRRLVIVDGILMEMDERMVNALIRGGIFTVVYPGTEVPYDPPPSVPNYPPDWVIWPLP